MSHVSSNTIIVKLCIPNKIVRNIRVFVHQKISIINKIPVFSANNKILFISKGMILSYNKTMSESNICNGDYIFGLKINEKCQSLLEKVVSQNSISISDIRNDIPIFGPNYEVNLTSINMMLSQSSSPESIKNKMFIHNKVTSMEIARLQDLKAIKKENFGKIYRKIASSSSLKRKDENNFHELTNIDYEPLIEPCCEPFPDCLS